MNSNTIYPVLMFRKGTIFPNHFLNILTTLISPYSYSTTEPEDHEFDMISIFSTRSLPISLLALLEERFSCLDWRLAYGDFVFDRHRKALLYKGEDVALVNFVPLGTGVHKVKAQQAMTADMVHALNIFFGSNCWEEETLLGAAVDFLKENGSEEIMRLSAEALLARR